MRVFRERDAELGEEFDLVLAARGREGWESKLPTWDAGESLATRKACSATRRSVSIVCKRRAMSSACARSFAGSIRAACYRLWK